MILKNGLNSVLNTMFTVLLVAALVGFSSARQRFIVGGEDSQITDFPWQGSWRNLGSHSCGCVLVNETYILSAAHCVGGAASQYTAGFGNTDRTDMDLYDIQEITIHPDYGTGPGFSPNDIALIVPSEPVVTDGEEVDIIPIAPDTGTPVTEECYISGWGRISGGGELPETLQSVQIPVISDDLCDDLHGVSFQRSNMICVWGGMDGGIGACNGDSGGPLQCDVGADGNKVRTLYGLTSWGRTGCDTDYPSVYNRVGAFREWLCEETDGDVACD